MIDREIQRANRKSRQWGRHGRDRIRWGVNQAYRNIQDHYYYRDWNYFADARRKWEALTTHQVSS